MFFSFTFGFQEIKRAVTKIALRDLRWLQNFNHPLVKLIVICKICNKEIDTFSPTNWKVHYKFHGQKGYKCHQCGKGTTRRCITVCIWTGTKLYNAIDKSAYFVTQVINMNVRFHILALSVLMWKVCFMEFFFFFCLRFCL